MSQHGVLFFFILALTFVSDALDAQASGICDYYRRNQPEMYKLVCENGSASSKPAGANSTFSDAFNINSGSLSTEPSSYGFEAIGSWIRNNQAEFSPTFSLIKGFHKFGTGISTSSNNTFYGNDIVQRELGQPLLNTFASRETPKGSFTNLNIGTSVELFELSRGPIVRLGLSGRYNNVTDTWGGGPGLMLSWDNLTIGAGFTRERVSNLFGRVTFESFLISSRISGIEFEYTLLRNIGGYNLQPIQIVTATKSLKRLTLTVAERRLNYVQAGIVYQTHYAIQFLFSKSFSAGFLYNYIPGANSVGAQYYL